MLTEAEISQNHHPVLYKGDEALEDNTFRLYLLIFSTESTARNEKSIIIDSKRMYRDCARNAVSLNRRNISYNSI